MDVNQFVNKVVDDVSGCFAFYTRLPVSLLARDESKFGEAQWATPIVGLVVGLIGWLAFWLAAWFGLPPTIAAALALGAVMVTTGCLHEDGVADIADGFGGGNTRERKLEIMKDSRNGTFGVIALVLTILLRWAALASLLTPWMALWGLIAAHAGSRMLFPAFMHFVRPAKPTGLGASVGLVSIETTAYAVAIGAVIMLISFGFFSTVAAFAALAIWFAFMKILCERQIGGQTGDVLGTVQQGAEIILLMVASATLI